MTTTEIREALAQVQQAVSVPPVDEVAFRARVRTERRRRHTGRTLAVTAAAVVAVVAGTSVVSGLRGGNPPPGPAPRPGPAASAPAATIPLDRTVYFGLDGELTALAPSGHTYDVGVATESVVGSTRDRVYTVDGEQHLVARAVERGRGGRLTFRALPSPVAGVVTNVVMSADGRYLAARDAGGSVRAYDLDSGEVTATLSGQNTYAAAVDGSGLLLSEDGGLVFRSTHRSLPIPTSGEAYWWVSSLAQGRVVAMDARDRAQVYDVTGGSARLLASLPGAGVPAPTGASVATLSPGGPGGQNTVRLWDGATDGAFSGLDGDPVQIRWADGRVLLVVTQGSRGQTLWACVTDDRACTRLPVAGRHLTMNH